MNNDRSPIGFDGMKGTTAKDESREISKLDYDLFINLAHTGICRSELSQYLEALIGEVGLLSVAATTTVALAKWPEELPQAPNLRILTVGPDDSLVASDALYYAIRGAARLGRHLVVVLDSVLPANEVLHRLIEEFERDPLFGTVQPRFADAANDHVWPLPDPKQEIDRCPKVTRAGLAVLSAYVITPELLSACVVIRNEVVREMDHTGHGLSSVAGELRLLLCQARRRGYRNLVINHAVIASPLPYGRIYVVPPKADLDMLAMKYPDSALADVWNANLPQRKFEAVLARAYADHASERLSLLLDCRGMQGLHNGTSHAILGLLNGFNELNSAWQISVLAWSAAIEFHRLRERYPKFKLLVDHLEGTYTVGVLLNQPWSLPVVDQLHRHSFFVAFNMLDTISWDILYVCDNKLDALWRFVARFADGFLYISQFTRDRFNARFALHAGVVERISYLSLAADEYVDQDAANEPVGEHILIFGNDYDHKDVRRTLQILVDAFPFNKIVAIGIESAVAPNVVVMPSGHIDQSTLHRLIASARVIVFPSFYEGFGMPVVQGLAYSRPVIVRQSPLWNELAAQLRSPGALVPFDSVASLVEAVGCALAGLPLKALPQGANLGVGESPLRWRDCAQRIIDLADELMSSADGKRWQDREEALQTIRLLGA
jgi:glycosyltransferase involved in cell wall biosynthesis